MALQVQGKSALITGGGSGINFCLAEILLSKGCNVLIADLALRPEASALVEKYSSGSPLCIFHKTDVSSWPALDSAFSAAIDAFKALDIIVPGAGVFEPAFSNFWYPPGTPESIDTVDGGRYKMMDINVTHPIRLTQIALQYFIRENRKGSIVHVSSVAGQTSGLFTPMYFASKHAIHGFVRSLQSLEKEIGVRVTAIAPGVIKTPLWTDHPEKMVLVDQGYSWATPEEVAEAMLKLIEEPDMVGGTILECGREHTRRVEAFNDPGPNDEDGKKGLSVTQKSNGADAIIKRLRDGSFAGTK